MKESELKVLADLDYIISPVSYTHLDVYKRQGLYGGQDLYGASSGHEHFVAG